MPYYKSSIFIGLVLFGVLGYSPALAAPFGQVHIQKMPGIGGGRVFNLNGHSNLNGGRFAGNTNRFSGRAAPTQGMSSNSSRFAQLHPRREQVISQDRSLNQQINADRGHLNGQYRNLENQDRSIMRQEQVDAARNGGYITPSQQAQMDGELNNLRQELSSDSRLGSSLNTNSTRFAQLHPRREQVISQDQGLNQQINADRGHLDGQYRNLESQDQAIMRQEQADAARNGGYITVGQKAQLDKEETALQQQLNQDYQLGSRQNSTSPVD